MTDIQLSGKYIAPLSESPLLRYFTFIVLYFSQGIPEGITIFAIPAWMAINGKSAAEIAGYSAVILVPFSLKIVLAPIMERYTYLPMGRRRPWLLFGQFGILCSLVALSFVPDPLNNIALITVVALCVHIFIMFQDIATDSLVIDIVPVEQQGKANSLMWGAKTIGTSVAMFIGSWLMNHYGFSDAVLAMSSSILLIMFVPLLLKERKGEKLVPWSAGKTSPESAAMVIHSWRKIFSSFRQVIMLPNTLILLITVFIGMCAVHYLVTLFPIFTIQELGWSNVFYSEIFSSSNLLGGIIGMITGGLVIQRFGIIRLLQGSLIMTAILAVTLALTSQFWKTGNLVSVCIAIFCTLRTLIYIGVLALAMQLCWKRISAIQFTFCMTIFNAGLASGAALLGYFRSIAGWQSLFIIVTLMFFIAVFILKYIKTGRHLEHVALLEVKYAAILEEEGTLLVKSETS